MNPSTSGAASALPNPMALLSALQPPAWLVGELQNRLVLLLNHVLQQEPAAMERLRRQRGKPLLAQWGAFSLRLQASAAGLLELAPEDAVPELTVTLTQASLIEVLSTVVAGQKPAMDVRGDVLFAAEVAWLAENVRWDVEEDLSRVLGDGPAHSLAKAARGAAQAIKGFVRSRAAAPGA